MLLRIQHETKLSYSFPVSETVFEIRMAPPTDEDQTGLSYRLRISPQAQVTSYRDGFGNRVDLFNVATQYHDLVVHTTSFVRTHRRSVTERLSQAHIPWPDPRPVAIEALEFLQQSPLVTRCPELDQFVASLSFPHGTLVHTLNRLMHIVRDRLRYEKSVTKARTPVGEALNLGCGVCQDFAHLYIGACRGLGLPARYVSGYVNQPGELATHAWCQVWAGEPVGWVDVDPTHSRFLGDDYVMTAVGRDYHDVPPNRGLWKGRAEESMSVAVKVEPVERVPLEWNEWSTAAFRPTGAGFQSQSLRPGGRGRRHQRQNRSAYPNQPSPKASLHQQQGEQQQQVE
jgi:transglutaminase-like putative cysteine protease